MNLSKQNLTDSDLVKANQFDDISQYVQPVDLPVGTQKNGQPDPIVVVFAADDNVAMPLGVTICSLSINFLHGNSSYGLAIYVLDLGLSEENKQKIRRCIQSACGLRQIHISFLPLHIRQFLPKGFENRHYPPSVLAKLMIPEVLHKKHTKCIYLDADLLVMDDISKLWEIDLQDFPLGVCRDSATYYYEGFRTSEYVLQQTYNTLISYRLVYQRKYFNSGVLVFGNIRALYRDAFTENLLNLVSDKSGNFPDQDALNIYFENQVLYLFPEWNFADMHTIDGKYSITSDYVDIIRDKHPSIIHYVWTPKPWHGYLHRYRYQDWYEYLDQTGWRGWRPSGQQAPPFYVGLLGVVHALLHHSRHHRFLPEKFIDTVLYGICKTASKMIDF